MAFQARRHRLELPPMPKTDDPATLKRAMEQMKRLVQDEFNRLSTDFYDFKKATFDAAILPLRGVSNIAVTKDEFSMTATWENPDGNDPEPTHVRVRILEISPNSWAEYTWPISTWSTSGLEPGTQYTFQVQLVARFETTDSFVSATRNCPSVPVLRTAESDIKAKTFTTDTGVGPPTDNGTNDDNVIFTFPDTDGTPGAVSSSDCWWGYKFQYRTACAWADTAVSEAFAAGNVGDVTIDTGAVPFTTYPNSLFRIAYREICDGVAQAWVYGSPFMAVDFSNADCLGITKSLSYESGIGSGSDLFALPGVCQGDGTGLQIVDAITDTEVFPQEPGFKCIEYIDSEWTLIGDDTTDTAISSRIRVPILSGQIAAIGNLGNDSDFTLAFDIKIPDDDLRVAGAGSTAQKIMEIGKKIVVNVIMQDASTYDLTVSVPRDGGGQYVFRANGLTYAAWHSIYYAHDVSEPDGRKLYLDGTLADESTNAIANDFDGITTDIELFTVNDMQWRSVFGWDRIVDPVAITLVVDAGRGSAGNDTLTYQSTALTGLADGDTIVIGAIAESAITVPTGFTSRASETAATSGGGITNQIGIWTAVEGTDVNLASTEFVITQAVSGRFHTNCWVIRRDSGATIAAPTVISNTTTAADPHSAGGTIAGVPQGSFAVGVVSCVEASAVSHTLTDMTSVGTFSGSIRGFLGEYEDMTAGNYTPESEDNAANHYAALAVAVFKLS